MGGVGKTELVLQYALKYRSFYKGGICFLEAHKDINNLYAQLIQFARQKLFMNFRFRGPENKFTLAELAALCIDNWPISGKVLIILDSVRSTSVISAIYKLFADNEFRILITTRIRRLDPTYSECCLEALPEDEAIRMLYAFAGRQRRELREYAVQLCNIVGCIPLGIELIGRHLANDLTVTFKQLSETLTIDSPALDQSSFEMTAQRNLIATFNSFWQSLDEAARQLGQLLSLFANTRIPESLIDNLAQRTGLSEEMLASAKN
ncbi:MAG: hypothetical protein F6K11_37840 [Leptolyngbya sp. SIO3F4]|nr:hypothetical protein [Leptolyngbya sp. SIO3F4]